ncbi:MAG: HlyD family efflux transporter periplasmic adaptor subunit [Hyphomicrobiaceae bacterium]
MSTAIKPTVVERPAQALDTTPYPESARKAAPKRRRWIGPAFGLTAIAGLASIWVLAPHFMSPPPPNAVPPVRPPAVVGLGYLEPASSLIKVGAPGAADALRVAALKVQEGEAVEAGHVLAVLDTFDKLSAQLKASEAILWLKRLTLERQKVDIASNLTSRRSALERARAELDAVKAEYDRQQTLFERGVTTTANVEKKRRELLTAQATVREMEAGLGRIETLSKLGPAEGVASQIDIAVTEQEVASAEADVRVTRASLEQATIRAPMQGRILAIKTRAGERFSSDGLLEMGATDVMQAVIEVYQSDVARVRVGQRVTAKAEALTAPVTGTVSRIGVAVKRQSVINNDPATATDARVVEVFVTFDAETSRAIANLSRLQVRAVFAP